MIVKGLGMTKTMKVMFGSRECVERFQRNEILKEVGRRLSEDAFIDEADRVATAFRQALETGAFKKR